MNDHDFLHHMLSRANESPPMFTLDETLRLWQLIGCRIPPHSVRMHYMRGRIHEHVFVAQQRITNLVIERLL
jgi:hypothetical protein